MVDTYFCAEVDFGEIRRTDTSSKMDERFETTST